MNIGPGNNAYTGGGRTPAATPTSVRYLGDVGVGEAGFPTPTFTEAPAYARQNRGSNVRIPYARIVPLRDDRETLPVVDRSTGIAHELHEYDGLHAAEVAWIKGRHMAPRAPEWKVMGHGFGYAMPATLTGAMSRHTGFDNGRQSHLAGLGTGPDRPQRLATTAWVEAYFTNVLTGATIDLAGTMVRNAGGRRDDGTGSTVDSLLDQFANLTGRATLLAGPDIAYAVCKDRPHANNFNNVQPPLIPVPVPMLQGLNVMEMGPFLTSYGRNREIVTLVDGTDVPRHLGSVLAQRALTLELKRLGCFNWVPDGVCLSKLENGPDSIADAEYDARAGQLFNVGVHGPCITKTWSHGDPAMHVLPGDRVFVLLVADVSYVTLQPTAKTRQHPENMLALTTSIYAVLAKRNLGIGPANGKKLMDKVDVVLAKLESFFGERDARLGSAPKSETLMEELLRLLNTVPPNDAEEYNRMLSILKEAVNTEAREYLFTDAFRTTAEAVRSGRQSITTASMTNFRLMRATSSFLVNTSHIGRANEPLPRGNDRRVSRCGLRIGAKEFETAGLGSGTVGNAEYIVGGWCVGTVLDSAASRALGHAGIRVAPTSMAYDVSVDVQWWDADRLYDSFADVDRGLRSRDADGAPTTNAKGGMPDLRGESTMMGRSTPKTRTVEGLVGEATAGYTSAGGDPDKTPDDNFTNVVQKGVGDYEGTYIRPDPTGPDADPVGTEVITRAGTAATRRGDGRVWATDDDDELLPRSLEAAALAWNETLLDVGDDGRGGGFGWDAA